ncbi:hypothetical protein F4803DRAFT_563222 [Xylaria telfairii]|nr:hypothetical protein F4803DRAFT_563222 [Xylaria telfairii]
MAWALGALLVAQQSFVSGRALSQPNTRGAKICYEGETYALLCYTLPDNTPQNLDVADVTYVASYLRAYGRQLKNGRFFTMNAADTPDCGEWSLYSRNTVLATAKHLNDTVNSSVLFEDIATTIDGGENATDAQKMAAIIGCLTDGGSLGVLVNSTNPAYGTATYLSSGYTPDGILIKITNTEPQ